MTHSAYFTETDEGARRQYIDAEGVFRAWRQARKDAAEVRGSMRWRQISGHEYLLRISTAGSQTSLGPRTAETERMYESFMGRKREREARLATINQSLQVQQRLCRAQRVGRMPSVPVRVLKTLDDAGLAEHFLVIGTHALYAYETAAGVRITQEAMATQDVDILFDMRTRLEFSSTMSKLDSSLLNLLRKADPTFRLLEHQKYTLRNDAGFEVDIVRRQATEGDPHPLRMTDVEGDVWPSQIPTGQKLGSARRFDQVVVSVNGEMALMRTVHPLDFARVKRVLSQAPGREALKRGKDALQAQLTEELVREYLPHLVVADAEERE